MPINGQPPPGMIPANPPPLPPQRIISEDIRDHIIAEFRRTVKLLGGKSDIQAIANSYRDTCEPTDMIAMLRERNDAATRKSE